MTAQRDIDVVFFDVGGTLANYDPQAGRLVPFADSAELLRAVRERVGVRVGVITNLGPLRNTWMRTALEEAGLAPFLDPEGFVSDHDAGVAKPAPAIYLFAAQKVATAPARCLYVGDDPSEVIGALAAGMKAFLRPAPPAGV